MTTENTRALTPDDLREYEPDRAERARHFAKLAVHDECDRRICERFPIGRQLQILAGCAAIPRRYTGHAHTMLVTDASAFDRLVETMAFFRVAATSLCAAIDAGTVDPRHLNVKDDVYWSTDNDKRNSGG